MLIFGTYHESGVDFKHSVRPGLTGGDGEYGILKVMRIIFTILVIVLLGVGGYWFLVSRPGGEIVATSDGPQSDSSTTADNVSIENSTLYSDPDLHYSFSYPKDLDIQTYDEESGGHTVTFESDTPGVGFQVFVVPYSENYITPERFKTDDPSGVMNGAQDIVVDGAPAKIFAGHNDQMGDTREVWFIRGGYLYEVTTYKSLDTWLGDIMTTWKFI